MAISNITAPTLTAFQALIDTYKEFVPGPRNKQAARAAQNLLQKQLGKEAMYILTQQIDPTLLLLKPTEPEFYAEYLENRVIVNAGGIVTQIKGTIISSTDDSPVIVRL